MAMNWRYSARSMRVAWVGLSLLALSLVFLYFVPLVSLFLGPVAWGVMYYATTMDRRDHKSLDSEDGPQVVGRYRWANMSVSERVTALAGAVGVAMVLAELVLGKPSALLWSGLALATTGSLIASAMFVLRHKTAKT